MASQLIEHNCPHIDTNEYGQCYQCGMYITCTNDVMKVDGENISSYVVLQSTVSYEEIKNLTCISEELKALALDILQEYGKGSTRESIHRQEMFAAIYNAFVQKISKGEVIPFDPQEVAHELGLSTREYNSATRSLTGIAKEEKLLKLCKNMDSCNFAISPMIYIEDLCEKNKLSNHRDKICDLMRKILIIDRDYNQRRLLSRKPKNVALALLKMYITSTPNVIYPHKFSTFNKISDNVLKTEIAKIKEAIGKSCNSELNSYLLK